MMAKGSGLIEEVENIMAMTSPMMAKVNDVVDLISHDYKGCPNDFCWIGGRGGGDDGASIECIVAALVYELILAQG
ncbi:uncharacterized protein G2W53_000145 [Senna tora]|uniref:Uncharacterized protein n=1 Tax=Senna tora TaxID=362788 RepID=A0A835CKB6_9FABA|nr:uncharacterized protein G2W53_000145 [Senna tora]